MTDQERITKIWPNIALKYDLGHLHTWATSILSTDHADVAAMVAEDPSVMDVVGGYVHALQTLLSDKADEVPDSPRYPWEDQTSILDPDRRE
jgi:hypothetical protein